MIKRKKILIGLTTLSSIVASYSFVACSKPVRTNIVFESNLNKSITPFDDENSASYGSYDTKSARVYAPLFRMRTIGSPKYDYTIKQYTENAHSSFQLLYADKVVITKEDNTEVEYDNDLAEISPELDAKKSTVRNTSADERSINNPKFFKDLKNAKKLQVSVKEGIKWVDYTGKATKYSVKAQDFYYSWIRTKLLTKSFRMKNGGTEELDKYMKEVLKVDKRFGENHSYPNEYLFDIFDVDSSKFDDEKEFIQKRNDDRDYITFNAKGKSGKFDELFVKNLIGDLTLSAAPSDYLKEKYLEINRKVITDQSAFSEDLLSKGKAFEYGIYSYGFNFKDMLYAGAYYISTNDLVSGTEVWTKNPEYPDKDFTDNPLSISKIIERSKTSSPEDYKLRQYLGFKYGSLFSTTYTELTPKQQDDKYITDNLQNVKIPSRSSLGAGFLPTSQPQPIKDSKLSEFQMFNDNYSKILWGATKEEINKGNVKTAETFFNGTGLRFRTILESSINWERINNILYSETETQSWRSGLAPDGAINGSDYTEPGIKNTVREYGDKVNSTFLINKDLSRVENGLSLPNENHKIANKSLDNTIISRSVVYDKAKKLMKELLDEVGINEKDKVEFTLFHRYTNEPSAKLLAMFDTIISVIESLDPRLKVSKYSSREVPGVVNSIFHSYNDVTVTGWGYDYDGIGSGFDGLVKYQFAHMLGAFSIYSQKDDKDPKNSFPAFTRLSKALYKAVKDKKFKIPTHSQDPTTHKNVEISEELMTKLSDVANWKELTNGNGEGDSKILSGFIKKADGSFETVDHYGEFAKFLFDYQKSNKNQELIDLAQEITTLTSAPGTYPFGRNIRTINRDQPSVVVWNNNYSYPINDFGDLNFVDIRIKSNK